MANHPAHPHDAYRPASPKVREAVALGDPELVKRYLTFRQRRFCEEYIVDYCGKAAAIRAGYATKHAEKQAVQLLKNEGISFVVDSLTASKASKIVAVDPDYIIQQVVTIISGPGAKDSDRLRGLELLARHLGMFIDRTELTGKDGGPLEINRKVEEDANTFTNLLKQLQERADKSKGKGDAVSVRPDGKRLPA